MCVVEEMYEYTNDRHVENEIILSLTCHMSIKVILIFINLDPLFLISLPNSSSPRRCSLKHKQSL